MVAHLMAQIFFQETQEAFSENIFCRHTTRPWGRRGGPVRENEVLVLEERRGAAFEAERVYTYVGYSTRFDRARTTLSLFVID